MAITFIKRSSIPVSVKGKVASGPTVSISDKGQMSLNTAATKFLNGMYSVGFGFDAGKVYIIRKDAKMLAKVNENELFALRKAKKGETVSFAATNLLKDANTFGEHVYDYANSGNQSFSANLDEKTGTLTFDLPKGAIAKRAVAPRKPRTKKAASVKAEAGSTEVITSAETEELVIDAA